MFVQESVYEDVVKRLERRFEKLRTGNNLDKCNDYSALIDANDSQILKSSLTNQSAQFGAKVSCVYTFFIR